MNILLIENNIKRFQPQVIWSELDEDLNLSKFNLVYIYVESANQVDHINREYPNAVFISDKDLCIRNPNFMVKKMTKDYDRSYDFQKKLVRQEYIKEYLYGR